MTHWESLVSLVRSGKADAVSFTLKRDERPANVRRRELGLEVRINVESHKFTVDRIVSEVALENSKCDVVWSETESAVRELLETDVAEFRKYLELKRKFGT